MDRDARFRAVFGAAYAPLCRYARHRGLTGADAEDIVAQTLEIARQARPLAVVDVIRRGDRRHRRAITRWSLGRARRPGPAAGARPGRRWLGWMAPLAAAAAVIAVVAGTAAISSAIHSPQATAGASLVHRATAYVVNSAKGTVTPIRTATNTPGKPIKVGTQPMAIAITPDGKTAYVANSNSTMVTPIQIATNTALPPIETGHGPAAIAITPDGKTAYMANGASGTVTPIQIATNTALPPIKTGRLPQAIAITPDGRTAYVSLVTAGVTPIRIVTNTALPRIKTGYSGPIAITPLARRHRSWLRNRATRLHTVAALRPGNCSARLPRQ